ncbi:hypothetical protein NC653_038260 [Populus alba x Populus x berolinensis]|uniref:Uncharacterized protein n=1 Tax=Populus alba x Populus x berolinensis TaxID=444605 RepID=A0AAD6LGP5_9ROSI|nr:hypothetical protein NC653_038260 [Populus alba x Populus x berolinensis]
METHTQVNWVSMFFDHLLESRCLIATSTQDLLHWLLARELQQKSLYSECCDFWESKSIAESLEATLAT